MYKFLKIFSAVPFPEMLQLPGKGGNIPGLVAYHQLEFAPHWFLPVPGVGIQKVLFFVPYHQYPFPVQVSIHFVQAGEVIIHIEFGPGFIAYAHFDDRWSGIFQGFEPPQVFGIEKQIAVSPFRVK